MTTKENKDEGQVSWLGVESRCEECPTCDHPAVLLLSVQHCVGSDLSRLEVNGEVVVSNRNHVVQLSIHTCNG